MKWLRSFIPPFLGSKMIYSNNKIRLYRLVINFPHLFYSLKVKAQRCFFCNDYHIKDNITVHFRDGRELLIAI